MKGDPLPNTDHVARFCDRKYITENNNVGPGAFMLRKDEEYLSVQWLENLGIETANEKMKELKQIFAKYLKIRPPAQIAIINVGHTCGYVAGESEYLIRILHQPEPNNNAHSGIFDTMQNDEEIAELIRQTILEIYPAS